MPSFRAEKLRVNLRLTINRLKLLEKKKTEGAMKARREIADYLKNKRLERARIRVEHIIREDYMVEAMEVVELYCDLLLARFGMLEQMSYCEDSLAEAVATLIWVTPRLSADVQELREISYQLENKFGKPFAQQARSNLSGTVNPKVIHRLGVEAPKKSLVENYMIEIARNYKIEYEPDPTMFLDDGVPPAMDMEKPFVDEGEPPVPHKQDLDTDRYVPLPRAPPQTHFPPPPAASSHFPPPPAASSHFPPPPAASSHFPPPPQSQGPPGMPPGPDMSYPGGPPSYPGPPAHHPPPSSNPNLPYPTGPQGGVQPPALPSDLDLPPVPSTSFPEGSTASEGGGDVDFDDLTRRFEELKRRK